MEQMDSTTDYVVNYHTTKVPNSLEENFIEHVEEYDHCPCNAVGCFGP